MVSTIINSGENVSVLSSKLLQIRKMGKTTNRVIMATAHTLGETAAGAKLRPIPGGKMAPPWLIFTSTELFNILGIERRVLA